VIAVLSRCRHRNARGSVSLETVILGPFFLLFIGIIVFGGRVAVAGQSVEQAAAEAARTASIARTQVEANATAAAAARNTLDQQGLDCISMTVDLDTTGFAAPAGTPATVAATVTCPVRLSDLALPGFPGSRTVTATAASPLDTYRERSDGFTISDDPVVGD
jgi:Flp pilus assembly protein TadG